jgi:hypothetical protein
MMMSAVLIGEVSLTWLEISSFIFKDFLEEKNFKVNTYAETMFRALHRLSNLLRVSRKVKLLIVARRYFCGISAII